MKERIHLEAKRSQNGDKFTLWVSQGLREDICYHVFFNNLPDEGVGLVNRVSCVLTVRQAVAAVC